MSRKIIITLTMGEATELELTAWNGYGDGDYYLATGRGSNAKEKNYHSAMRKLNFACHHKEANSEPQGGR